MRWVLMKIYIPEIVYKLAPIPWGLGTIGLYLIGNLINVEHETSFTMLPIII